MEKNSKSKPVRRIVQVLFFLIGIALLVAAAINYNATREFLKTAVSAPGVVYNVDVGPLHPEVMFTSNSGKEVKFTANFSYGHVGDKVEVLYDPAQPSQHQAENSFFSLWGVAAFFCFMGLGFIGVIILSIARPDTVELTGGGN